VDYDNKAFDEEADNDYVDDEDKSHNNNNDLINGDFDEVDPDELTATEELEPIELEDSN
jgi:hypothetical protein